MVEKNENFPGIGDVQGPRNKKSMAGSRNETERKIRLNRYVGANVIQNIILNLTSFSTLSSDCLFTKRFLK